MNMASACPSGSTAQGPATRILVIEDNLSDLDLIRVCLSEAIAAGAHLLHAATVGEALRILETGKVDLTLLDLALPDSQGMDALERLPLEASGPVIVVTGRESPSLLTDSLHLHAYDVLPKQELTPASLMRVVRLAQLQNETEAQLRRTEGRFRQVFEHSPDAIFVHTQERVIFANPAAVAMLRAESEAQIVGLSIWKILHPDSHAASRRRIGRLAAGETLGLQENRYVRFDGTVVDVEVALAPFEFNGRVGIQASARDITDRKARDAALREAERFARSTIDAPQNKHICVLDETGTILTVNKAWREFAENNNAPHHSAYCGANYLEVCALSGNEDARAVAEGIGGVMRGDVPVFEYEYECHSPAERRWFVARVSRFVGEGPLRLVVAHENITEKKRALLGTIRMAKTYAALSATNEAVFRIESEKALFQRICEIGVELGGLKLAAIRLIDPRTGWIRPVAIAGEPRNFLARALVSIHRDVPEGLGLGPRAAREGRPAVCNDCRTDAELAPWRGALEAASIGSAMNVPLRRGGKVVGLLSLYSGESGWFDTTLASLFERMAENLAFGLDTIDREGLRNAAEVRVRESEARFRSLTELSSDWYWEQDEQYRFLPVETGFMGDARVRPSDYVGRTRWDMDDNSLSAAEWAAHQAVLESRQPFQDFEYRRLSADGEQRYVSICGMPVFDTSGAFKGYRGIGRDITEKRRAEQVLALEHAVARTLAAARDADEGIRGTLRAVCESEGWEFGRLWEVDEITSAMRAGISWNVPDAAIEQYLAGSRTRTLGPGKGVIGEVCLTGEAMWIPDAEADARVLQPDFKSLAGLRATCLFPVFANGRTIGVLVFSHRESRRPDARMLAAARSIGGQVGQFLLRKHSEEGLRRFRAAVDFSADLVMLVDPAALRYIDVNDTACRMLGYDREELLAMGPLDIYSASREDLSTAYARLITGEVEKPRNGVYRCKDGTLLAVEANRTAVVSLNGNVIVSVARDIRQRVLDEERLKRFRAALDLSADSIFLVDPLTLEIVDCNDGAWRELGYTREELLGMPMDRLVVERTPAQVKAVYARLLERDREAEWAETTYRRRDGSTFLVEVHRRALVAGQGATIVVAARNITERRRIELDLRRSNERFEIVARATLDVVWDWDLATDHIWWNTNFSKVFGHAAEEFTTRLLTWSAYLHPEDHDRVMESLLAAIEGRDRTWNAAYRFKRSDGSYAHISDRGIVIVGDDGKPIRMIGAMADVTERKVAEEKLAFLAQFDTLTGLPNRSLLRDRLEQAMVRSRRRNRSVGVLFVDLDRFKLVNDTHGHGAGDRLLAEVAGRLRRCVRDGDTVGRISGDEFAVVLEDMAQGDDADLVARKILAAIEAPFLLEGNETFVTASVGASVFPADSEDAEALLKNADAAMYSAKEAGRNRFAFFTAELNERSSRKLRLSTELRYAIERQEFLLYYQPKVDLATGVASGFEALLRWQHPVRGLVSPLEFIPVLEDTGLIVPVGEWVIRAVCRQLGEWKAAGLRPLPVAINLSMRQFQLKNFDAFVAGILDETGIEAGMVEFELTESLLMSDAEETVRVLIALKARGLKLSVDDFGTGYSSLAYLKRFPIDCLKIDRAFIRDCIADPGDAAIALAVIGLAHTLGLKVVAEGVETEEQLSFLKSHGCDEIQGYYFSRPLPVHECAGLLSGEVRLGSAAEVAVGVTTLLVVDDYKYDLDLMREALEPAGYRVLLANDIEEAFGTLATTAVDVVISDHSMPGMSGVKFLAGVRQLYPEALRILFSGSGDSNAATEGVNHAGIHKFLSKNWDHARLRREIREALLRHRDRAVRL